MSRGITSRIGALLLWGVAVLTLASSGSAGKTCPSGRFKTTGKWKGCDCPKGSSKDYSGMFKSHAECKGAPKPDCPGGSFKTTGKWHGCKCPANHHKQWLDPFKYNAKCSPGKTDRQKCEDKGNVWIGLNHSQGQCVNPPSAKEILQGADPRIVTYQGYMKVLGSGVNLHSIHPRWRTDLQAYFDNDLGTVRFGISKALGKCDGGPKCGKSAITDCKTIYFPEGAGVVGPLANGGDLNDLEWVLHELVHTEQCHEAGNRNAYAYMWFGQMPVTTLKEVAAHLGEPLKISHSTIHDKMPMEKDAMAAAAEFLKVEDNE